MAARFYVHYNGIVVGIAMQALVLHLIGPVGVVPIGIDMPRAYAYDLRGHTRAGKTAIEVTRFALEAIRIIMGFSQWQHICIPGAHNGLDRLFLRIAVIVP